MPAKISDILQDKKMPPLSIALSTYAAQRQQLCRYTPMNSITLKALLAKSMASASKT